MSVAGCFGVVFGANAGVIACCGMTNSRSWARLKLMVVPSLFCSVVPFCEVVVCFCGCGLSDSSTSAIHVLCASESCPICGVNLGVCDGGTASNSGVGDLESGRRL